MVEGVKKKIFIETYGCQMNFFDTKRIFQVLSREGFEKTENPIEANLILINTCSVREKPEKKVFSAIGRYKRLKEFHEDLKIGICGCVAQQKGEEILNENPSVDFVLGPDNINDLPYILGEIEEKKRLSLTKLKKREDGAFLEVNPEFEESPSAFLTIIKGCNKVCSFCIVPYVRGREVSKPHPIIIEEIKSLVSYGIKEINLLGQNITSYGKDILGEISFPQLLEKVNEIEGLLRIRFVTSHPCDCDDKLFSKFRELPKLCEYFHLPVQSGSDKILKKMRRGYTRGEYIEKIERVRKYCPDIALSTDIIVGFPDESEEDFENTITLLQEVEFDQIFSFKYSPRPRTFASRFKDNVPQNEKEKRLEMVQKIQEGITLKKMQKYLNSVVEILVEGESKRQLNNKRTLFCGRTRTNFISHFYNPSSNGGLKVERGEIVKVRIKEILPHSMRGELI